MKSVDQGLLITKFHIPALHESLVSRPRLTRLLDNAWSHALALISAPAGYGKTNLLAAWSLAQDQPIAWLSLDSADNDVNRFLLHLQGSLQTQFPDIALEDRPGSGRVKMPSIEHVLTPWLNQLSGLDCEILLALDDAHVIENLQVHSALNYILDHRPNNLHMIIATRSDPPLPLSKLRAKGQMIEIRAEDLRFSLSEIQQFLAQVHHLDLASEDLETLAARTEGWIAGLHMAALSLRSAADEGEFVRAFAGDDRHIVDYLVDEVLRGQPDELRTFMLRTGHLHRLSGSLCDAVAYGEEGADRSQAHLELLERENIFLMALDTRRQWYRYHPLFADLLQQRLQRQAPEAAAELHQRASRWYAAQAKADPDHIFLAYAVEHSFASGDMRSTAALIDQTAEWMLNRSEVFTFIRCVERLPSSVFNEYPRLHPLYIIANLMSGSEPGHAQEPILEDAATDRAMTGALATARAMQYVYAGDPSRGAREAQLALEMLPVSESFLRGIVQDLLGLTQIMQGDFQAAIASLEATVQKALKSGNRMAAVAARCNIAGLVLSAGHLRDAYAMYQEAAAMALQESGDHLPVAGKAFLGLAEIEREWDQGAEVERDLQKADALFRQYGDVGSIVGKLTLARTLMARKDFDQTASILEQAAAEAAQSEATQLDDAMVDAMRVRYWIATGDEQQALAWSRALAEDALTPAFYHLFEATQTTLARVQLAFGDPRHALEILQKTLQGAQERQQGRRVMELLVLSSLAYDAAGEREQALSTLEKALRGAKQEGFRRVFLDEGADMARLLYAAAERGLEAEYAGSLLASPAFSELAYEGNMAGQGALIEPLSERELEILAHLAEGYTNQEIASALCLSVTTVKWHASNIYGKLSVRNRSQAVAKGRMLGLL